MSNETEWVLVPRGPTQAMLDAGHWPCIQGRGAKSVWATMLAAAPQPPPEAQPVAWMDPDSEDVIHDMRKTSWSTDYGVGGEKKARTYTTPLYAHPPPSAPVGVEGLIARWRKEAEGFDCGMSDGTGGALEACADDLEAALSQQPAPVTPVGVVLTAKEREWLEYAVDHMAGDSEPEDAICYEVLHGLMTRVDALAQQPAPVAPVGVEAPADEFNGDTPRLIRCIESLLRLDEAGALVPHGVGGHARTMLAAAAKRLSQQPAAVDEDWRKKAAEWLEAKAVEQEAANQRWPKHAACYREWRDRPGILRHLAFQVLAAQPGGSDNDR